MDHKMLYAAMMGVAVGDALGVPYEFKDKDSFTCTGMVGFGTHNQPAGTWSDDGSMTFAALESLMRLGKFDAEDMMRNFSVWRRGKDFTARGTVFDIGISTQKAIARFEHGMEASLCGGRDFHENGNGSLMRILPLAFFPHTDDDIRDCSWLTHAHSISVNACRIYVKIAENLISGMDKRDAVKVDFDASAPFERVPGISALPRSEIIGDGYVVHSLEAAIWCLINTESYKDCVLTAVNLGEDTDTTAAIAGGLAGILYGIGGEKGIPEEWISVIARKNWIRELCGA